MSDPTEDEAVETEAEAAEPTKAELQDELRERELPVSGTKEELIERLEEADAEAEAEIEAEAEDEAAEQTEEEAAEAEVIAEADLVSDEGEIQADSVAGLTDDARAAIAEFQERLDDLAVVLTDLEARNADPASGAVIAASAKVRAHSDDVQRHLGPLSAALQAVQDATTTGA